VSAAAAKVPAPARAAESPAASAAVRTADPPAAAPRAAFDVRISDADPERAAATAALLRRLADALGIDRSQVNVRIDEESARMLRPHAARGALADRVVRLDPGRFDPRASASRYVLAHELTHLAQARIARPVRAPSRRASEAEAHRTALALLAGAAEARASEALPDGAAAFDAGAVQAVDPKAEAEKKAKEAVEAEAALNEAVATNYKRELEAIRRLLKHWIITDGDVEAILQILEPLPFETATALIGQLSANDKKDYIGNINPPHLRTYRREVLASYDALSKEELSRFDEDLFEDMPLTPESLTAAERGAAVRALRKLSPKAHKKLDDSRNGANIRALRTTPLGDYDATAARKAQTEVERRRKQALGDAADDARVAELLGKLRFELGKGNAEGARRALGLLAGYDAGEESDPRFARPVADSEPGPAAKEAKEEKARIALPPLALELVVAELDAEGLVASLIRRLSEEDRYNPLYRAPFLALLRRRRPDLNLSLVRDLLSKGFLNWIWNDEAKLAYDIVTQLPPGEQERFRRLDDGELFRRLYDELPDEFKKGEFFHGVEVAHDAEGRPVDAARRYGKIYGGLAGNDETVKKLIADFERGVTRDNAQSLLTRLLAIGRPGPGAPAKDALGNAWDDRLRAVVRHLDARGLIEPLVEKLGGDVLRDRRYWEDLRTLFAARDAAMNARHVRDLLHDGFLDSVGRDEAFEAFQIMRALPEADRLELSRAEDGKMWERLTGKLTRSMVLELGLSYARTRTDAQGENPLRRRLADPGTWAEKNVRELSLLIAMDISAGDFDWVFWQSKAQGAWQRSKLAPLVARFELYDERAGRVAPRPHMVSAAKDEASWFSAVFGTRAYELESNSRMIPGADPFSGEPMQWQQVEGMRATVDLEQLEDVAGGALHSSVELQRGDGSRIAIGSDNREQALQQDNVVDIFLSAEQGVARLTAKKIALSRFGYITPSMTIRTGPITVENLDLLVRFSDRDLREPNEARLDAASVGAEEIVATKGDDVYGAQAMRIAQPHMEGAFEIRPMPDSPVLGPLFGFVWNLIFERAEVGSRGVALRSLAVSFSDLRIEGLQTSGGLSIASVSIEGAAIALGTNLAAYKRSLRGALRQRLGRARAAGDNGAVATLTADLARVEAELPELEAREKELVGLIQKMNRAGGVLPPDDEQRLEALQKGLEVGAKGGLVADIGAIRVEGVDGPVRLRKGTITNISGQGEIAADAFRQLTDAQAIQTFIDNGPRDRKAAGLAGAGGAVKLGMGGLVLDELVLPTAIPSAADLQARLDRLNQPPLGADPRYDRMRWQMASALALVTQYDQLRQKELNAGPDGRFDRTPEDQKQLNELARQIGALIDLRVTSLTVTGPSLSLGRDGGLAGAGLAADTVTAVGISKLGLSIDRAEAKGLDVGISIDWPEAILGEPTRSLVKASGKAKSLVLEGVQSDSGLQIKRLNAENFNGAIAIQANGILIQGLSIDRIDLTGANYASPTSRMWSDGTTVLNTLTATVLIPFKPRKEDEPAKRPGVMDADFSTFLISELLIKTVEADHLGYESLAPGADGRPAFKYRVEVESGQLGDVKLTNFSISMPKDQPMELDGVVDIASFTNARFKAAYKQTLSAAGTLDSKKDPALPNPNPSVHVQFARQGPMLVDLERLQFTGTNVDFPNKDSGKGITITKTDLRSHLEIGDTETKISGLHMSRMELSRVDWRMASGATVAGHGVTVLEGVDLAASYRTLSETQSEFQIDEFKIEKIKATNMVYNDPPVRIELRPQDATSPNGLEISKVVVRNLLVGMDGDKTKLTASKDHPQATIGVGPARMDFVADYAKKLKATGRLQAQSIDIGIGPKGEIGARSRELQLDADANYDADGVKAGGKFSTGKMDTGDISYANGVLSIGASGGAGLSIPQLTTSVLNFENDKYKLTTAGEGLTTPVSVDGITLAFDLNLHRTEAEKKAAGTPFRSLVIRHFEAKKVTAAGVHLELKEYGAHLDLPAEKPATVGPITLKSPSDAATPGEPFTITPQRAAVPATGGKPAGTKVEYGFSGVIDLVNFAAPRAQVQLSSVFNARMDLGAEHMTFGFLKSGDMNVDVENWSAKEIAGYVGNDPNKTIRSKGLKGQKIGYDSKSGKVTATGTELLDLGYEDIPTDKRKITLGGLTAADKSPLAAATLPGISYDINTGQVEIDPIAFNGFKYEDSNLGGTTITIKRISTQDTKKIVAALSAAGGGKTISIPHVLVEDGNFEMKDVSATKAGPAAAAPGPADPFIGTAAGDWINKNHDLFAALNGTLELAGNLPEVVLDWAPDFDYGNFALNLPITNGEVSFQALKAQLLDTHKYPFNKIEFLVVPANATLRLGKDPGKEWLVEWDLSRAGEVARATSSQMMGVDRLLRAHGPIPAPTTPPGPTGPAAARQLQLNRIDLTLRTASTKDFTVDIDSDTSMVVAGDGLKGFRLTGALQPLRVGDTVDTLNRPGQLQVAMGSFTARTLNYKRKLSSGGTALIDTGAIEIGAVDNTTIDFVGWAPHLMKGHFTSADVRNIEIKLPASTGPTVHPPFAPLDLAGKPKEPKK
jgi:uncharacterized protein DUF4157